MSTTHYTTQQIHIPFVCGFISNYCPPTSLLISRSLSGAVLEVALIIFEVWFSDSFLMQRWPGTRLHTYTRMHAIPQWKLSSKIHCGHMKPS